MPMPCNRLSAIRVGKEMEFRRINVIFGQDTPYPLIMKKDGRVFLTEIYGGAVVAKFIRPRPLVRIAIYRPAASWLMA